MRDNSDKVKIRGLMHELGNNITQPLSIYFTGNWKSRVKMHIQNTMPCREE